jgi:tetratricopeptide (TPR) repeat protein
MALMALFVIAGAQGAQDPLADALRKGVVQEETNQNLDAAIQAYQSVLTQFGEERKTAATALFRLAECYRKQGKNDPAIAAYKRVVQEFADQTKLAEQSRTVLAQTFKVQTPQAVVQTPFGMMLTGRELVLQKELGSASSAAAARQRYRQLIEAQIKMVEEQLQYAEKQYQLGASSKEDVDKVRIQLLNMQRELAGFDAGIK